MILSWEYCLGAGYSTSIVAQNKEKSEEFALTEHIFYSIFDFLRKKSAEYVSFCTIVKPCIEEDFSRIIFANNP